MIHLIQILMLSRMQMDCLSVVSNESLSGSSTFSVPEWLSHLL